MSEYPSVTFHTIKECYAIGEAVAASFTATGFFPSKNDWLGVFSTGSETCDNPFTYQCVPVSNLSDFSNKTFSVVLNIDHLFDNDISSYEVRYVTEDKTVMARTKPFSVAISAKKCLITVTEGASFDDTLVVIDKRSIGEFTKPEKNCQQLHSNLLETQDNLEQLVQEELVESTFEITNSENNCLQLNNNLLKTENSVGQLVQEELESVVEAVDNELSCNLKTEEITRRKRAEAALEQLSRKLAEQMTLIDNQNTEVETLRNTCEREKCINELLRDEYEAIEENTETFASELEEIRAIATNYKIECSRMRRKMNSDEDLLIRLKHQIMDDREQHEELMLKLKEKAEEELLKLQKNVELLEEVVATERSKVCKLEEEIKTVNEKYESETKQMKEKTEKEQNDIQQLTSELQKEKENNQKQIVDYDKVVSDLESRVANESSNASRLKNDIIIAENRVKDATEDIKFFRQQFIDTEQKLQKSQSLLTKTLEELNNLKNTISNNSDCGSKETATFSDDKSVITCESSCVSACNSNETITTDRRRRTPGDVTDFTDDESWCSESINSPSMESLPRGVNKHKPTAGIIQIDESSRQVVFEPASVITTEEEAGQPISVIDENRRNIKKGRRRFGKPIDLSLSLLTNATEKKEELQLEYSKDIRELDREVLEKQYTAIRLHRNSLIRENTYMKNRNAILTQDMVMMNKNVQNIVLEAEHKLGMMQVMLNNQEYIVPSSNMNMQMYPIPEVQTTPQKEKNTEAFLSPFAAEYTPANLYQHQPIFFPPPPEGFFEFMAQQSENGFFPPIPPPPPQPNLLNTDGLIDVSQQLAVMGIPVSNNH